MSGGLWVRVGRRVPTSVSGGLWVRVGRRVPTSVSGGLGCGEKGSY